MKALQSIVGIALVTLSAACGTDQKASESQTSATNMPQLIDPMLISCTAVGAFHQFGGATLTLTGTASSPSLQGAFKSNDGLNVTGPYTSYATVTDFYRMFKETATGDLLYGGSIRFPGEGLIPQSSEFDMAYWNECNVVTRFVCTRQAKSPFKGS